MADSEFRIPNHKARDGLYELYHGLKQPSEGTFSSLLFSSLMGGPPNAGMAHGELVEPLMVSLSNRPKCWRNVPAGRYLDCSEYRPRCASCQWGNGAYPSCAKATDGRRSTAPLKSFEAEARIEIRR